MLRTNTTLEELSLSDNAIGELGNRDTGTCGSALAAALEVNSRLRVLDLTYNALSPAAMELLRAASERRATPLELRLWTTLGTAKAIQPTHYWLRCQAVCEALRAVRRAAVLNSTAAELFRQTQGCSPNPFAVFSPLRVACTH